MNNAFLIITSVVLLINIVAFFYVGADKKQSREHSERTPEVNFFVFSIFFGSLGILTGMYFFRHKTKKANFVFGITAILIQHLTLSWFIIKWL